VFVCGFVWHVTVCVCVYVCLQCVQCNQPGHVFQACLKNCPQATLKITPILLYTLLYTQQTTKKCRCCNCLPPQCCRLVNAAPDEWCCADVVPPSLADAVAAAALDGAVAAVMPALRPAAALLLKRMRPVALEVLDTVTAVSAARAAAADLCGGALSSLAAAVATGELAAGRHAARDWLARASEAVPALGYSARADATLLRALIQGTAAVAMVCDAQPLVDNGAEATDTKDGTSDRPPPLLLADVSLPLLSALGHDDAAVRCVTLQLATAALTPPDASTDGALVPAMLQVLQLPEVTHQLIVCNLGATSTRTDAAALLTAALQALPAADAAAWLTPWRPWVACHASQGSTEAALAAALDALLPLVLQLPVNGGDGTSSSGYNQDHGAHAQQDGNEGLPPPPPSTAERQWWCGPLLAAAQDLFSADGTQRRDAAARLISSLLDEESVGDGDSSHHSTGLLADALEQLAGGRVLPWQPQRLHAPPVCSKHMVGAVCLGDARTHMHSHIHHSPTWCLDDTTPLHCTYCTR
jgi:hypothetical protein